MVEEGGGRAWALTYSGASGLTALRRDDVGLEDGGVAALWAALLFDAAPSANQVAGGALVVAASCLVAAKAPREP